MKDECSDKLKQNKRKREWAKNNKDRRSLHRRKYLYGIDEATLIARQNAQADGLCKICANAKGTNLDHNHATGTIRGFLCGNCNRGLGLFKDDVESLERAIQYLKLYADVTE